MYLFIYVKCELLLFKYYLITFKAFFDSLRGLLISYIFRTVNHLVKSIVLDISTMVFFFIFVALIYRLQKDTVNIQPIGFVYLSFTFCTKKSKLFLFRGKTG